MLCFMKDLQIDKYIHGAVCFSLVAVAALLCHGVFGIGSKAACGLIGVVVAMLIGVGKETYDYYFRKTGFSLGDLAADGVGAVVGFLCTLLM